MKRAMSFLLFLLIGVGAMGWAEENKGTGLTVTGKAMGSFTIGAAYLTPSIGVAWQPDLWGIGLEVRGLINPVQGDWYLIPFLEGRVGWFFLGAGLDLPMGYGSTGGSSSSGLLPAATLGLDIPIVQVGPGKLGASFSADAILTVITATSSDSSLGNAIGTILLTIYGTVKVSGGLNYAIPL